MLNIVILKYYLIALYRVAMQAKKSKNLSDNTTKIDQVYKFQNRSGTKWIYWGYSKPNKWIYYT